MKQLPLQPPCLPIPYDAEQSTQCPRGDAPYLPCLIYGHVYTTTGQVDSGEVLLEWDDSQGARPKPLLKDIYASERRKAKVGTPTRHMPKRAMEHQTPPPPPSTFRCLPDILDRPSSYPLPIPYGRANEHTSKRSCW